MECPKCKTNIITKETEDFETYGFGSDYYLEIIQCPECKTKLRLEGDSQECEDEDGYPDFYNFFYLEEYI